MHTRFVDGGISYNGGYTDYVITPTEAVASILDELSAREAAQRDQIQAAVLYANIRFSSNLNTKCS